MIYRYKKAGIDYPRVKTLKNVMPVTPPGLRVEHGLSFVHLDFTGLFEQTDLGGCIGYKSYKAPLLPKWRAPEELVISLKSGPMLDVYLSGENIFVSSAAKKVINDVTLGAHQFIPVRMLGESRELLDNREYFTLNVRHYVKVTGVTGIEGKPLAKRRYSPTAIEKNRMLGIEYCHDVLNSLESIPLWRPLGDWHLFYLNNTLLDAVHSEGLTGFELYSRLGGVKDQAVTPIYL